MLPSVLISQGVNVKGRLILAVWLAMVVCRCGVAVAQGSSESIFVQSEAETETLEKYPGLATNAQYSFAAGTWTFQTYGSASFGDENGEMYTGHIGVGYHVIDNLSMNFEAVAGHVELEDGEKDKATMAGLELLLRYHFLKGDGWSVFGDLVGGLQQTTKPLPFNGTHFNFRPQLGLGVTWFLNDQTLLLAGARWLHISNGGKNGEAKNPGYDSAMIYLGLMMPF